MGHQVLTVQEAGNANLGIPDEDVLAFAIEDFWSDADYGREARSAGNPNYRTVYSNTNSL